MLMQAAARESPRRGCDRKGAMAAAVWFSRTRLGRGRGGRRGLAGLDPSYAGPAGLEFVEPERPTNEIGITVIGESSALGVPYEGWLSLGEIVGREPRGERSCPRRFRLEILGREGGTLETMHPRSSLVDPAGLDVLIVYSGHNEFPARFSPSRTGVAYYDDERVQARGRSWLKPRPRRFRSMQARRRAEEPGETAGGNISTRSCPVPWRSLLAARLVRPPKLAWSWLTRHRRLEATGSLGCSADRLSAGRDHSPGQRRRADLEPPVRGLEDWQSRRRRVLYRRLTEIRLLEDRAIPPWPSRPTGGSRRAASARPGRITDWRGCWNGPDHSRRPAAISFWPAIMRRSADALYHCTRVGFSQCKAAVSVKPRPGGWTRLCSGLEAGTESSTTAGFHDNVHPNLRGYLALAEAVLGGLKDRALSAGQRRRPFPCSILAMRPRNGVDSNAWALVCMLGRRHAIGARSGVLVDRPRRADRAGATARWPPSGRRPAAARDAPGNPRMGRRRVGSGAAAGCGYGSFAANPANVFLVLTDGPSSPSVVGLRRIRLIVRGRLDR